MNGPCRSSARALVALALLALPVTAARAQSPEAADSAVVTVPGMPPVGAPETDDGADDAWTVEERGDAPASAPSRRRALEPLVPGLAGSPYRIEPGVRPFLHRLSFSPGFGRLGAERLFSFRLAYNPNDWLGYEGSVDHNPGQAVHAAFHMLSVVVRRPLPGRLQPYASAGYGMVMVFPGRALNADPVTKNAVAVGGGLEFYVRGDLALRGEMRRATVFGRQGDRDGIVAFDYLQQTIGLTFYRTLRP